MKRFIQMDLQSNILLAVIFGVAASFTENPLSLFQAEFNSTFPGSNNKLLQPIVIPNLTIFTDQLFSTTPKVNETLKAKANSNPRNFILGNIYYPDKKGVTVPQETKTEEKYTEEEPKSTENIARFSSRYSSENDSKEIPDSSEESEEVKDVSNENEGRNITDTGDRNEFLSRNDNIEKYKPNDLDPYPTISYYNDNEDTKVDVGRHSDINETEESEESEVSPTSSEAYSELRTPTSFSSSHYPDEDYKNYETSSASTEEKDSDEEVEEKRSANDYHDSGSKNYHSVQTPLNEIKFRGPHAFKDDFDKTRTRLVEPIKRIPIAHKWPYSKTHSKEDADKLNEISDSDEKENSEEWHPDDIQSNSKLDALVQAAEKDEAEIGKILNMRYNYLHNRKRQKEQLDGLKAVEEKDHASPLFQSFRQYKVDEEVEPSPTPKINYVRTSPISKITEIIWSTSPTYKESVKSTEKQKLFSDYPKSTQITPVKFNITKELTPNFKDNKFLGPVVFNQHIEEQRVSPIGKIYVTPRLPPNEITRSGFLKDLEKKETIDRKNLKHKTSQNSFLDSANIDIPSQSFNHQDESDEMYNQILANIQSIFGLRTQPLKNSSSRNSGQSELNVEENKALTWALPLRKIGNRKQESNNFAK